MLAMSSTMTLRGQWDIKFKKWIAGSEMAHSIYTGPGEVLLAPSGLGDVMPMRFNNDEEWYLGKECFLASTSGIKMMLHRQKLSQAVFSGEGLFVYKVEGQGIVWTQSFGAIIKKEVCSCTPKKTLEEFLTHLPSLLQEKSTLSTMVIWSHGLARSTGWSVPLREVSFLLLVPKKGLFVDSSGQQPCTFRRET